jgi:hypothetical protein
MILTMVILNVVFAVLVLGVIVGLHGRVIATGAARAPREDRIRRAPRAAEPRWSGARPDLAAR